MPPKKRKTTGKTTGKTAGGGGSSPQYIWLLKYDRRYESITGEALYSTKEKAIAALPHLMKAYTSCGDDWKNGLEGFGLEDEDPYLGFEYFGDSMGDEGGELLSNQNSDTRTKETVYLKRLRVDPVESEIRDNEGESTLTTGDYSRKRR